MAAAITIGGSGWRIDQDETLIAMKAPDSLKEKFGPTSKPSNRSADFHRWRCILQAPFPQMSNLFGRPEPHSITVFTENSSQTPKCINLKLF
jgi:hypothetical protein